MIVQINWYNKEIRYSTLEGTTWKLYKMNLAIRGIDSNIGSHNEDTFLNDLHKGLKIDYIMADPTFNIKN